MDYKTWKSGRHQKTGRWPAHAWSGPWSKPEAKRFRLVCPYCMEHKRTCPVCAGVI